MGFRVLVVDDMEVNRSVLTDLLRIDGYEVTAVGGGEAALRAIAAECPDLVLLDVMMPDLSGIEVCRRIRANAATREIAVIIVTALADRESRLAGFEAEADDFISKPVDGTELRLRVRAMARLSRFRTLLEERSRGALLAEQSPDAILLCGHDGTVIEANLAAVRLLGGGAAVVGLTLTALFPNVNHSDLAWLVGGEPTTAGSPKVVATGTRGHQRVVEVSRSWHELRGQTAAILLIKDVTELAKLRITNERLRRQEAIGRAATGIAHDFRNYLTAIQMGLELLDHELPPDVTAGRDTIREMQAQIDAGIGLTHRITATSHGNAQPAAGTPLDLQATLRGLEPLMRHWAAEAGLLVDLGPVPRIQASAEDVLQIVSNLVVNASQAVGANGLISVSARPVAAAGALGAVLEVSDNGCGMDDEVLDRIFDAYFSTRGERGGTGLGLATVHETATRTGATIEVESVPGSGSTFRVTWPAAV